ncbi:MAG: TonB-dependent receptor [Gammaproteobacteria bacterium]|nr:TonB-dependent receptor [Gammaproteobacteria bacterium]
MAVRLNSPAFGRNLLLACLALLSASHLSPAAAQAQDAVAEAAVIEEIVVIGSRKRGRSAAESTAPIDVISGETFGLVGNTADITENLRVNVPSYNASIASGDGDTFVRPTSLRGLAPDQTLVMVNGKRRHRAALIAEFVPSAGKGAHGPNIGMLPGIAFKRVEILRDGASAQYGSDAIAGVINFVTRDASEGGELRVQYGQFYEGEQSYAVAGNVGLSIGAAGFLNLSAEYTENDALSRGIQRASAQALIDAGVPGVGADSPFDDAPLVHTWGRAYGENLRLFFNAGIEAGANATLYAQGNYSDTFNRYRFFYRGPDHITLRTLRDEFGFTGLPGGFTPFFDGDQSDSSIAGGLRGELAGGLLFDLSLGYGHNRIDFVLNNTINQSLGLGADGNPAQRDFDVGDLEQEEVTLNADFSRQFTDTVHLAFGAEWREETFIVIAGEPSSWFGAGSSGFKGFEPQNAGEFARDNYALYAEVEQDVTDAILAQYALRYEDFSDFGGTINGKVAARYNVSDRFALRAALSTGFHAPTPGQANIQKITTTFDNDLGLQVESGTVPPSHPLALAAGGSPLTEEKSINLSVGFVTDFGEATTLTADLYRIEVQDRIFKTQNLPTIDPVTGVGSNVQFFTNALDLSVTGLDLVLTAAFDWGYGGLRTTVTAAYNHNEVKVDNQTAINGVLPVSEAGVEDIEESYPQDRLTVTATTSAGANWAFLARINYFGAHYDERGRIGGVDGGPPTQKVGSTVFVDLEFSYRLDECWRLTLGASNAFDEYIDVVGPPNANRQNVGLLYPRRTAANFEGGSWYLRANYVW